MLTAYVLSIYSLLVASFLLGKYLGNDYSLKGIICYILAIIFVVFASIASIAGIITSYDWFAAEQQAKIINREYGTSYTQEEVFFAKNVINSIQDVQRHRNEVTFNVNSKKD